MAHENTVPQLSLDQLVDVIGALLVVLDTSGRIVTFNAACERVTGYSRAEVAGKDLWQLLIPPDETEAVRRVFRALTEGKGPNTLTNDWVTKEGVRRRISWSNTVSRRPDGSVEYVVATGVDISDQIATETALRNNRSLLQMIIGASPDAIITVDSAGIIESFNGTAERLFGYAANEVIGRNVSYLMPEPYASEHDQYVKRYLDTGERRIIGVGREVTAKRKNGTIFPIELAVGEVEFDEHKRFTGFIRDISRRRAAEKGQAESDRRLAEALDGLPLGVILCDTAGRLTHINREMRRFMALVADDLKPGAVYEDLVRRMVEADAINLDSAEKKRWLNERLMQIRSPERTRAEFEYADGSWVLAMEQKTPNGELVALRIDITQQKVAEAALRASLEKQRELQSEFHHVSRLSAMGEMAATLAHELNQPLTAVINYVQACRRLLQSGGSAAESKVPEFMNKAVDQAHRAGEIISHLRGFVTRGDAVRARADINDVVGEACDLALVGAKAEDIDVALDLADDLPLAIMDRVQIQQVIVNLVRNSVDALQDCERRAMEIRTFLADPSHIAVSVSDTGPGLDPNVAAKLFEPFNTSKKEGMGIGLSVCRSIVQEHSGTIEATSNPGGGVVFTVTLPLEG